MAPTIQRWPPSRQLCLDRKCMACRPTHCSLHQLHMPPGRLRWLWVISISKPARQPLTARMLMHPVSRPSIWMEIRDWTIQPPPIREPECGATMIVGFMNSNRVVPSPRQRIPRCQPLPPQVLRCQPLPPQVLRCQPSPPQVLRCQPSPQRIL